MGGSTNPGQSKVKVIVRVRPLLDNEPNTPCACAVDSKHVRLIIPGRTQSYSFKYDSCYDVDSLQESIFEREIQPRISSIFEGLNTTVFAYGNTGAGKTFTMQGSEEKPGIIPRVAESMIDFLSTFQQKATIHMSYVELYNEKLYDLLLPRGNDLAIREDKAKNIIIPDLTEVQVKSISNFKQLFDTGCKHRSTGATKLNPNSSRSHAILMLKVQVQQANSILTGKFNLIDLAGSEDNRKTGNKGIRLTESANINQSLFVLGNVVNSLNSGSYRIPYRDSKLTRILQDSLGGTSYSVMIANIAPTAAFYADTLNTLNFALKSRNITNKPTVHSTEIAVIQATVPVTAEAEYRKQQLEAWKKGKNNQSNKENVENNSGLNAQMEKLQQELKHMQDEVKKGKSEAMEKYMTIESTLQQFLGNQVTLLNLQQLVRAPHLQTDNALLKLPKNLGAMTPCSQMTKIKQLLEVAQDLTREYRYPQAIELYNFVMPHLTDALREKAINRIAFLQQCLCKSFTPGSFIHKMDESDENTTYGSAQSTPDEENESYSSDDEALEPTPYKPAKHTKPTAFLPLASLPPSQAPSKSKLHISPPSLQAPSNLIKSKHNISPPSQDPPNPSKSKPTISPPSLSLSASTSYPSDDEMLDTSRNNKKHDQKEKKEKAKKLDKVQIRESKVNSDSDEIEKSEEIEKAEKKEKTDKSKKKKKEASKRYISSDEDYDDDEQRKKKTKSKRAKKTKDTMSSPEADSPSEERREIEARILVILNNGDKKELLKLSGVGEKRALKILEYRKDNPPFTKVSDLREVGFTDNLISSVAHSILD